MRLEQCRPCHSAVEVVTRPVTSMSTTLTLDVRDVGFVERPRERRSTPCARRACTSAIVSKAATERVYVPPVGCVPPFDGATIENVGIRSGS